MNVANSQSEAEADFSLGEPLDGLDSSTSHRHSASLTLLSVFSVMLIAFQPTIYLHVYLISDCPPPLEDNLLKYSLQLLTAMFPHLH